MRLAIQAVKNNNQYKNIFKAGVSYSFAKFKKFNYEDGLNFQSLLNEEELMVRSKNNSDYVKRQKVC